MAKYVVAAALCLVAVVAVAVGQSEAERQRLRDLRCEQEVQESPLDACRRVLDRQLASRMRYGTDPFQWAAGARLQCCQQLQDVSRGCRCSAIRRMVRGYEQTMPPLGGGGYFGGEEGGRRWRQGEEEGPSYYGYGEMTGRRQGGEYYGEGCRCGGQRVARVTLTKARQYAAGLPMMCRLDEPQECSVFSAGQDY